MFLSANLVPAILFTVGRHVEKGGNLVETDKILLRPAPFGRAHEQCRSNTLGRLKAVFRLVPVPENRAQAPTQNGAQVI